jgi:hypothetical protein
MVVIVIFIRSRKTKEVEYVYSKEEMENDEEA